ncbi:MAG: NepR family anti-sigma factor [Ancalomicrobiaceae bacterium]|nr:NepR family anti-sigma factor [Ancalomicrobiaceae bacterium]
MNSSRKDQPPAPTVEPKLQAHIGRQLRQLYDQMVSEPVPDRFKALLDQLESRETAPAASDAQGPTASDTQPEQPQRPK